ncbi:PLD nuclease N-terminal domain-containing protein [uncultured Lutibacter sp.]|uniref:PLD nuclease N-terminal domain-containing protein n=1 Tax=uncultured Lutibacter sp. TaxID=437739 RepID=UPI002614669B|nr:PLD nuclease N-terminal domain-containing protein [uncultured Lutibacter sp.]
MNFLGIIGSWQLILILCAFLIPIIALIDILRSDFKGNEKLIWVLVVLFTSFIGTILYFLIGRNQRIKKD